MQFFGIDFGWTSQPSGVAWLRMAEGSLYLEELGRLAEPREVVDWVVARCGDGPAMVAIDAPTVIRNVTGMREADRAMHRHFGKQHAGSYPANLGSAFAARTLALSSAFEQLGFRHADAIDAQRPGRYQIEVYPHAAMLHLFALPRILKYKKGRLAERRAGMEQYRQLMLDWLPCREPRLALDSLPEVPATGPALKALEDQLDALLCTYIGAWWWHWGSARTLVAGNAREGFIVVPVGSSPVDLPVRGRPAQGGG
jgi:predicted RNase H-like nuclease